MQAISVATEKRHLEKYVAKKKSPGMKISQ
jgi:hypothetical protein